MSADYSWGVAYTPSNIVSREHDVAHSPFSLPMLEQLGVRWIRVYWLDYTNILRYHVISRSHFKRLLNGSRPGIPIAKATMGMVHLTLMPGQSGTGEWLYSFDTNSFRLCPFTPGHASIMGFFQDQVPTPSRGLKPIPICPRGLLKRIVDEAQSKAGVAFLVGFESEFILLKDTSPITAVNFGDYSCATNFPNGAVETKVIHEIADSLEAAGIDVLKYHGEAAPGQYEMVTGPLTPLEAADAIVSTRELIYNVATKHGLKATFAPRIHKLSCGSGSHIHVSVHNTSGARKTGGPDASRAPTLTSTERSFLQGLLTHLPAVCALTLPTPPSYGRMHDGIWAGGTYAAWGTDNREASVRLTGAQGSHHFEVRCADATSNPFLAIAGIVAAGTLGIMRDLQLESGDCPEGVAFLTEEQRKELGVENAKRLPRSLDEARKNLEEDKELRGMLGEEFFDHYVRLNTLLAKFLTGDDEDAVTKELLGFY